MGLLDRGIDMLNRLETVAAGVSVVYSRGAVKMTITAVPGNTRFAQSAPEPGGAMLIHGERDYLIDAADLVPLNGPEEEDRVTETINGTVCVYRIARPDTGEPAIRFSDAGHTKHRVHTKLVK